MREIKFSGNLEVGETCDQCRFVQRNAYHTLLCTLFNADIEGTKPIKDCIDGGVDE